MRRRSSPPPPWTRALAPTHTRCMRLHAQLFKHRSSLATSRPGADVLPCRTGAAHDGPTSKLESSSLFPVSPSLRTRASARSQSVPGRGSSYVCLVERFFHFGKITRPMTLSDASLVYRQTPTPMASSTLTSL
eukprot:4714680-Pleurochrysis_carterae.AAC.2